MFRRLLDSPWLYFGGAIALLVVAVLTQFDVSIPSRKAAPASEIDRLREREDLNVVFLLVDTLRADRISTYGYQRPTTPILDDIAAHGIVFERVLSQSSWTKTSMASLWTGTHPMRNGILRYKHVIPQEAVMPAEIMREAGFRTVGLWRNGWVEPNFGFDQGFEIYVRPTPGRSRQIHRQSPGGEPLGGTDEDMITSATDFLDRFGHDRFFLYMHFMDLHQYVYDDLSAIFGTTYSDVYDQSINWTDRLIGLFLRELDRRDLLTRTLIVLASDHGEAFREHGFEGHARNLYAEVSHVPFVIALPFLLEPGIRVKETVSNADIWPTLLDLLGLPPLPGADGVSLLPLVRAAGGLDPGAPIEPIVQRPLFSQLAKGWGNPKADTESLVAVAHGGRRLIVNLSDPKETELFDPASDPKEQRNLAGDDPDAVKSLRELVDAYEKNDSSPWGAQPGEAELDELRLNHLRALGYVVGPDAK
jgi:arylsulfatase A-like enzyme